MNQKPDQYVMKYAFEWHLYDREAQTTNSFAILYQKLHIYQESMDINQYDMTYKANTINVWRNTNTDTSTSNIFMWNNEI